MPRGSQYQVRPLWQTMKSGSRKFFGLPSFAHSSFSYSIDNPSEARDIVNDDLAF